MEEDLQQPQLEIELAPGRTVDDFYDSYEKALDLLDPNSVEEEEEEQEQPPSVEQVEPAQVTPPVAEQPATEVEPEEPEEPDDTRLQRMPYQEPILGMLPGAVGDVAGGIQSFVNAPFEGASDVVLNHINAGLDAVQNIGGPSTDFRFKRSPLYEKDWMNSWRNISGSILFEVVTAQAIFKTV